MNIINVTKTEIREIRKRNEQYNKAYAKMQHYAELLITEKMELVAKYGKDYEDHYLDLQTGEIKQRPSKLNWI